jgi:hypothetical protein
VGSLASQEANAVVSATRRTVGEGIHDSYCVCRVHRARDLTRRHPANLDAFIGRTRLAGRRPAAVDESYDSAAHILVGARKPLNFNFDAGFLCDSASHTSA